MKMKKCATIMATAALVATMAVPAFAAPAQLRSDFSIVVDGKDTDFKTASGQAAYPILYNGSTYLPLRAVGELMGKNVNWDKTTKTIDISGSRTSTSANTDNPNVGVQSIDVAERSDFKIKVDGVEKTFYSVKGERIYPVLYNGSTYLPLRSVGELMGKEVVWDSVNKVVTLKNGGDVTDADSFGDGTNKPDVKPVQPSTPIITREKAKEIALGHAGLLPSQVTFINAKTDWENGIFVYEVEFYTDTKEFDYEIDAATGKILSYDFDVENWQIPAPAPAPQPQPQPDKPAQQAVTLEKAKQIALDHAGVSAANAMFTKAKQDYDDGRTQYEIEFRVGMTEYDYEIDAATGRITDYSVERDD